MEKNIESLMIEHGFTSKDISLIKAASERSGYEIMQEICILKRKFHGVVFVFFIALSFFIFMLLLAHDIDDYINTALTFFISMPIVLYFSSVRLTYKSFMFIKKHKG
ncbi:hypothetical protein [Xenorhabdus sp. PB62.4]|uniref:hypothetical protein n=1 Tax=Xenorhabdus sp. PB62.4 TaxID=1851573 RepID=UPI001657295E|nr:hypothetical protein [Xenorhabdus sp. PB62.4]MBC8952679.1 hypothetical protein [Xenorhabdus sp. PB62.4]